MIPLLVVAAWGILSGLLSGLGLAAAVQRMLTLLAVMLNDGQAILLRLQAVLSANPALTVILLSLIPITLIWLLRFSPHRRATDPGQGG